MSESATEASMDSAGSIIERYEYDPGTLGDLAETLAYVLDDQAIYARDVVHCRLSMDITTAVGADNVTNQHLLYCYPYKGNEVTLYDGDRWRLVRMSRRIELELPDTTETLYDVFLEDLDEELVLSLHVWASDTARTQDLDEQDGVLVHPGDPRLRFLGIVRTGADAGMVPDSASQRFCLNYYNRLDRPFYQTGTTTLWQYTTPTWRPYNNDTGRRIEFICFGDEAVHLSANPRGGSDGVDHAISLGAGLGLDATDAPAGGAVAYWGNFDDTGQTHRVVHEQIPAAGYHYAQLLEYGATNGQFYSVADEIAVIQGWIRG